MQFDSFITSLAEKAGISKDDKSLIGLLSANTNLTIPDNVAAAIDSKLFNEESAKNNPSLRGYFHAQALSVPDNQISDLLDELKFDDTVKSQFQNEKSTPKKIKMLANTLEGKYKKLIDEMQKADGSDKSKERIEKLTKEIETREKALADKDSEWAGKVKALEDKHASDRLDFSIKNILATKKYANDKQGQDLNVKFANLVLQEELQKNNIKLLQNQDGTLKMVQADNPDLEYMDNHKKISFGDFADKALANHNLLFVSDPKGKTNAHTPITPSPGTQQVPKEIIDIYDKQLATLSANGQS